MSNSEGWFGLAVRLSRGKQPEIQTRVSQGPDMSDMTGTVHPYLKLDFCVALRRCVDQLFGQYCRTLRQDSTTLPRI